MSNVKCQMSNVRRSLPLWRLIFIVSFIFFGCSKKSGPADAAEVGVADMRIVSMAPNLTEILFGLGLDEEIVGVTKYSTYPPKATEKTCVGTFWQPDIEAILMLRPTLVVTLGFEQQVSLAKRLKNIGCQTLTVNIESINELYQAIDQIGQMTKKQTEAQQMLQRLKAKQQEIVRRSSQSEKPKVLWVIQREPLRVAGTKTYINELIEIAGGVNAVGQTIQVYPPVSTENVIRAMPDVIIEPSMDPDQFEKQKATAEDFFRRFSVVPAVKNSRVFVIDGDLVSRLAPRLDEGMELVYQCVASPKESQ